MIKGRYYFLFLQGLILIGLSRVLYIFEETKSFSNFCATSFVVYSFLVFISWRDFTTIVSTSDFVIVFKSGMLAFL